MPDIIIIIIYYNGDWGEPLSGSRDTAPGVVSWAKLPEAIGF